MFRREHDLLGSREVPVQACYGIHTLRAAENFPLDEDETRLREAAELICEINLGATAIGTGINAHPDYARTVCEKLCALTGFPLTRAKNLVEATPDCGCFVHLSGVLKRVGEIHLPAVQAGSSIMPGKPRRLLDAV